MQVKNSLPEVLGSGSAELELKIYSGSEAISRVLNCTENKSFFPFLKIPGLEIPVSKKEKGFKTHFLVYPTHDSGQSLAVFFMGNIL